MFQQPFQKVFCGHPLAYLIIFLRTVDGDKLEVAGISPPPKTPFFRQKFIFINYFSIGLFDP